MSVKVSKLIEDLQWLQNKYGDCIVGIRYDNDIVKAISMTGSTTGSDDVPGADLKSEQRIFWITSVDPSSIQFERVH